MKCYKCEKENKEGNFHAITVRALLTVTTGLL